MSMPLWIALGLLAWTIIPFPLAVMIGKLLGNASHEEPALVAAAPVGPVVPVAPAPLARL